MNEKLQIALADIITKSVQTVEAAGQFILNEAPDVVQQLLVWKFVCSVISFSCFVILPLILVSVFLLIASRTKDEDTRLFSYVATIVSGLVIWCLSAGISCGDGNALDWVQIKLAPKIYLIEYASKLIR